MKIFLLTLMVILSDGSVKTAEQRFNDAHACADAGIAFVTQEAPEKIFGDGARIAFVCEPKTAGDPA